MALTDTESKVTTQIDKVDTIANDAIAAADSFILDMKSSLIGQPPFFTPTQAPLDTTINPIDADAPVRPNIESAVSDMGSIPTLADLTVPDIIDAVLPDAPTRMPIALNAELVFTEEGYVSDLLTEVKSRLLSDMQEGGIGLNQAIEDGYWTRKKERDEIALQEAKQKLAAQWGRSRFKLPTGALNAALLDLEEKFMLLRMDSSREIAIKQMELALNNKQFTITNTLALEQITLQHYHNIMDRALRSAIAVAEFGINFYNTKRNEFLDDLNLYKAELDGANIGYQGQNLKMEGVRIKAGVESQRLQAYKTRVETYLDKVRALTTIYSADTDMYKTKISKGTAEAELKLKGADIQMRYADGNLQLALENARMNLQAFLSTQNAKISTITEGGKIYEQRASAALNALNAIIQLGYSGIKSE